MDANELLPIGTIVLLKGANKRIMVTGFLFVDILQNKNYDYCGCAYPEGMTTKENVITFNHNQIDSIYHIGYSDKVEKNFKESLNKFFEDNKQNQS
ncbi:MAG: DUF4176 domain-containing protein [Bacilli bacterium]|nr:DUF4176 domain-containing protein [Bacilli bacterium]